MRWLLLNMIFASLVFAQGESQNQQVFSRVTPDFTTTSTTAVTVTGLSFSVNANTIWMVDAWIKNGASSITGNKFAIVTPAGCTISASILGTAALAGTYIEEQMSVSGTLTTTAYNTLGATTAAIGAFCHIHGLIVVGSTAGTVAIQVAKVTSGTATVYANSYILAKEL